MATAATTHRASGSHLFAEVIATLGLLLVIFALARSGRGNLAPAAVGAYIGSAYFFTSSTSSANPATGSLVGHAAGLTHPVRAGNACAVRFRSDSGRSRGRS